MASVTALRIQIENALESRFPSALTPQPRTIVEMQPTGLAQVDTLLGGGLPVGAISEVTGAESTGRTSLVLAFLASLTRQERVCAWVDVDDCLDAESAAASGVSLRHLLWVRCRRSPAMPEKQSIYTRKHPSRSDYSRLDQALRATDLLLQAGGFAALVLDLGSTAPEHALRIPLATWFRFRQGADRSRCSLVVLGQRPFAQASAALVLECSRKQSLVKGKSVLSGFRYQVERVEQRFAGRPTGLRKAPASSWTASAAGQGEECA